MDKNQQNVKWLSTVLIKQSCFYNANKFIYLFINLSRIRLRKKVSFSKNVSLVNEVFIIKLKRLFI